MRRRLPVRRRVDDRYREAVRREERRGAHEEISFSPLERARLVHLQSAVTPGEQHDRRLRLRRLDQQEALRDARTARYVDDFFRRAHERCAHGPGEHDVKYDAHVISPEGRRELILR
jgi:hypothetical protein